jgi:hypothetical protein
MAPPRNQERAGKSASHLKLEKPRFHFLEGWGGASTAPAGTSAVPAGTSTDNPTAVGSVSASGADSTAVPSAYGDEGAGSHLSAVVHSSSLSSSSSDDEFTNTGRGESRCFSCSRYSSLCCSRRSHRMIFLSFARAARSRSRCCAARPEAWDRGVSGSDGRARSPAADGDCHDE